MVALITTAGLALEADALQAGTSVEITQIQGGLLRGWGDPPGSDTQRDNILRATRMASRESPVSSYPTPESDPNIHVINDPFVRRDGSVLQYQYNAPEGRDTIEIGFFAGNTMYAYETSAFGGALVPSTSILVPRSTGIATGLHSVSLALDNVPAAGSRAAFENTYVLLPEGSESMPGALQLADSYTEDSDTAVPAINRVKRLLTNAGRSVTNIENIINTWWARSSTVVPSSKLTGLIPRARIPGATTISNRGVRVATGQEVINALAGNDPAAGIQDKVATLQAIYDARAALITDNYTTMTQAEYDALTTKVAGRMYNIRE